MKEYRSRWQHYTIKVRANRLTHRVTFDRLPDNEGSYFKTDDIKMQEALESSSLYGSDFRLHSHTPIDRPEPQNPKKEEPDSSPGPKEGDTPDINKEPGRVDEESKEEGKEPETEETIVEEVENITEAREYLIGMGIDYRRLNSPKSILNQAVQNKVKFPNLKV